LAPINSQGKGERRFKGRITVLVVGAKKGGAAKKDQRVSEEKGGRSVKRVSTKRTNKRKLTKIDGKRTTLVRKRKEGNTQDTLKINLQVKRDGGLEKTEGSRGRKEDQNMAGP